MWKLQNSIKVGISNRFAAPKYAHVNMGINKARANIRQDIKTLITRSIRIIRIYSRILGCFREKCSKL